MKTKSPWAFPRFNEAATTGSRKFAYDANSAWTTAALQGGRDHVIAEIDIQPVAPLPDPPLQGGRDHVIAEIRPVAEGLEGVRIRFNEAATTGSRKYSAFRRDVGRMPGFNEAATTGSRKGPQGRRRDRPLCRFNEAATTGSRKGCS